MAEISGGEVIVRMLQAEGVQKVFGIIDGAYLIKLSAYAIIIRRMLGARLVADVRHASQAQR